MQTTGEDVTSNGGQWGNRAKSLFSYHCCLDVTCIACSSCFVLSNNFERLFAMDFISSTVELTSGIA